MEESCELEKLKSSNLISLELSSNILESIDKELVKDYHMLPIKVLRDKQDKSSLVLATSKMVDNAKMSIILENMIGVPIFFVEFSTDEMEKAIHHYYGITLQYNNTSLTVKSYEEIEKEQISGAARESSSRIVQTINSIIQEAIRLNASDIHIEPMDNGSDVQLRIHGDLVSFAKRFEINRDEKTAVVNIIKNMCKPGLDITIKQTEQKGQFIIQDGTKLIDCRVSICPTIRQEKVVIRLLDPDKLVTPLEELGYDLADLIRYKKRLVRTSGLIMFVAPTGHGKTTALYASMMFCDPKERKINAVEDPPEYRVEGITQIAVRKNANEELNFTYLKAIEALLRQDPDIMLIGETRGKKEAEAVLEASKTGHLLFTTLHARDSTQAMPRIFNMGIDRRTLLSEMICIVSQRLVRVNCSCAQPYMPSDRALLYLTAKEIKEVIENGKPKKSTGTCPECHKAGRRAIAEFLFFDNETRDYFANDHGIVETMNFLKNEKGFRSMWEKGLEMVKEGEITLESLVKVLDRNEDDDEELRTYHHQKKVGD